MVAGMMARPFAPRARSPGRGGVAAIVESNLRQSVPMGLITLRRA